MSVTLPAASLTSELATCVCVVSDSTCGRVRSGSDFLHLYGIPNFFFHLSMAYANLRTEGMEIGKADFDAHHGYPPVPKQRVCVVTGANKGIGKAIALALASTPGLHCIATARDESRGQAAVAELVADGGVPAGSIETWPLDLDSEQSIADFAAWLAATHREIGVLVNNAAIAFNSSSPEPFSEQAAPTIHTNFTQTRLLTVSERHTPNQSASGAASPGMTRAHYYADTQRLLLAPMGRTR